MTNEELMKPRYKVIADWPGSNWEIGQVLCKHSKAAYWWCVDDSIFDGARGEMFEKYPHLFHKLEWWEERKAKDMPEYIRFYMPAREKYYIRKVETIKETHTGKHVACCGSERYYLGSKDFPATEAEYLAALNTTKQQDNG